MVYIDTSGPLIQELVGHVDFHYLVFPMHTCPCRVLRNRDPVHYCDLDASSISRHTTYVVGSIMQ